MADRESAKAVLRVLREELMWEASTGQCVTEGPHDPTRKLSR